MILYLHPELEAFFQKKLPLFQQIMDLPGTIVRQQPGRVTQRVLLGSEAYFLKKHTGVGVREILKNVFQLRLPVLGAENEWKALKKMRELGLAAPLVVGYGQRGKNPAYRESFVLMKEVKDVISLEMLTQSWNQKTPSFHFKLQLINELARISSVLHQNHINHRDLYLCHFLLDQTVLKKSDCLPGKLFLIDLHRAQMRRYLTPKRWIIKDLAALYFSSKDTTINRKDWFRFMRAYSKRSLKSLLKTDKHFWERVQQRGEKLYRDHN